MAIPLKHTLEVRFISKMRVSDLARMLEELEPQPHPSNVHPGGIVNGEFVPGTDYTRNLLADVRRRQADPRVNQATLECPEETRARVRAMRKLNLLAQFSALIGGIRRALSR